MIACALGAVFAVGCSKKQEDAAPAPEPRTLEVFAVNYPLAYFAERLAPEGIEVRFPVPAEIDPAFWKPSPEMIAMAQRADVILLNGAGYARWIRYATLPKSHVIVTAAGCRDFLPSGETIQHQHGPEGKHAHGTTAFTTWLDLRLATCQARHVRDALTALQPSSAHGIENRYAALEQDLGALDDRLRKAGKAWGGRPILASHPVYQYLADAYGLDIESLHLEPSQPLDQGDLDTLDAALAKHPATLMLWEAKPLVDTERQLRERGISVVVFDPASQRPPQGDFIDVMTKNSARLACATGSEACP